MLEVGASVEASFVVRESDTAQAISISAEDAFPEVFATSRMVALTTDRLLAGAARRKP
jgi:hypothetical protein